MKRTTSLLVFILACIAIWQALSGSGSVRADARTPRIVASVVLTNPTGTGSVTSLFTASRTGPYRITAVSVVSGATPGTTGCGGGINYDFTDDYSTTQTNQVGDTPLSEVGVSRVLSAANGTVVSYQLFNFNSCATSNLYIVAEEL